MKRQKKSIRQLAERMYIDKCDVVKGNIPEPPLVYNVGDRVRYGAWKWTGVLEVFENGKYYKLFSVTYKTKRNIPDGSEFKIHYEPWHQLVPYRDSFDHIESLIQDDDIFFSFYQRDIRSLLNMCFKEYGIDLEPDYQRGNVWNEDQKVALIDSIFKNIDIGKFAIIRRPWPWGNDPNKTPFLCEMLDGKQRLTALVEFFCGRFRYRGKYYNDLHPFDQNHFRNYGVSVGESEGLTNEQKYRYFLKLNTTGSPVDPEHMERVEYMLEKAKVLLTSADIGYKIQT